MSFCFLPHEAVQDGVRRIAHEQVEKSLHELTSDGLTPHEVVHQVRKRCKKLRGLIRLTRPQFEETYQRENAWYRDAARELSFLRDAQTIVTTFDRLNDLYADQIRKNAFASIRQQLVSRRRTVSQQGEQLQQRLEEFTAKMREAKGRIDGWCLDAKGFDAVAGGLGTTYGRGCRTKDIAYEQPTTENFHQWRKRTKYHWYHLRLLKPIWPNVLKKYRATAKRLSDYLGNDHDLAVLRATLLDDANSFGSERDVHTLIALMDHRRRELQTKAKPLGERLFAEKPKQFLARMRSYWQTWEAETSAKSRHEKSSP